MKHNNNMAQYVPVLSGVLQATEDTANTLNTDFETLRRAIDLAQVAEMTPAQLQAIQDNFQRGTDAYRDNLTKLEQVAAPVRLLGRHKTLVAAYTTYVTACQAMTDSIDVEHQAVQTQAFSEAEATQEHAMAKVTAATQRIMSML